MSDRGRSRIKDAAVVVGLLVLAAVLAYIIGAVADLGHRADALREELTTSQEDAQMLAEQVEDMGGTPSVTPPPPGSGPTGPPGPIGPRGRPPTAAEVRVAVSAYCADRNGCRGPGPTQQDVAAAVNAYCDDRGQCRGPAGEDGTDGADAPPPSDEQVAAAVAAYCSERNECRGPRGEPGADSTVPGPRGPPGPTCPDGYHREDVTVLTDEGPRQARVCVQDDESEEP